MRTKRTYNLPERTVLAVRELAATYGVAGTQDGVIELAVDELARRLREDAEADRWVEAAADPAFRDEAVDLAAAYGTADRETWPRG
jgi:threonine dehydrogenase-like Zn-dependent dehydrogenase